MAASSSIAYDRSKSSDLPPPPSGPAADPMSLDPASDETERLCQTENSRGLAKHFESMVADIPNIRERIHTVSDVPELQQRVQAALRLAPNPAKLVYKCCKQVEDGQAYVLFLELFLQMIGDGEVGVELSVSTKAHVSAWRWRNMYRARGGCEEDNRIQARAFLLFLASFGIPAGFPNDYVMNLIILSYPSDISETLQKSQVLIPIIPDMIKKMLQYKLYGEAIDVAFTFGVEDKFPYKTIMASLKGDFEKTSMKPVKEMEKAFINLARKFGTMIEALGDRGICLNPTYFKAICGLAEGIQTRLEEAEVEANLRSKSKSNSVDHGKRDEMEMEHPSLARRLSKLQVRRKCSRKEFVICYLI